MIDSKRDTTVEGSVVAADAAPSPPAIIPCEHKESEVIDNRRPLHGPTRRRRRCVTCGFRWTTYEITADERDQSLRDAIALDRVVSCLTDLLRRQKRQKWTP